MSATIDSPLLVITEANVNKIKSNLDLDTQKLNDSVSILHEWCSKQDHFVTKDVDERILERLFILAKGSIEATKQKVDKFFSARAIFSELTLNRTVDEFDRLLDVVNSWKYVVRELQVQGADLRLFIAFFGCCNYYNVVGNKEKYTLLYWFLSDSNFNNYLGFCANKILRDFVYYVPLPKLNPKDLTRVMITQFHSDKLDDLNLLEYFRYSFLLGDYRLSKDYSFAERYIIDFRNIGMSLLGKINPVIVKKSEILCTESYGTQIKGIHIINAPSFVDKILFILKQALKEKVANRIFVHKDYEDLHQHIPKSILPRDYGGDEPTVSKFAAQWKDELKSADIKKYFEYFEKLVSDESLRRNGTLDTDFLGMQGSFRKLNVD